MKSIVDAGFVAVEEEELGAVAGQRVERVGGALEFVGRGLPGEIKVEGFALQGPDAANAPDGGAHLFNGGFLGGVPRGEVLDVLTKHLVEAAAGFVFKNGGSGEQAVTERIHRGAPLAGGSPGAG
ncbi:MAG: hypothetical protein Q8N47_03925 [Bryobacterales bacterium]|nr:hypothetical protein [Bryobacterales bacterium]